jgi:hypothetical protein
LKLNSTRIKAGMDRTFYLAGDGIVTWTVVETFSAVQKVSTTKPGMVHPE